MSDLKNIVLNGTEYGLGGSVDSELSASSERPVQNKVINTALGSISLGTDPITGLLYVYVNGQKQGTGVDIGAEGIDTSTLENFT